MEGFMTTILVTGGAGYIGAHFCKLAAAAGLTPVVYDDLSRGHAGAVKWGPLVRGSLSDREALSSAFGTYRPRAVVHFAALTYVGESVRFPMLYYRNNVEGSLALIEAMHEHGVRTLVLSSTAAVYGEPHCLPIPESHGTVPVNPYGATKLAMERMIEEGITGYHEVNDFISDFQRDGIEGIPFSMTRPD